MINALIIDDELEIRNEIRSKIALYFSREINIIEEADSVASSLALIEKFQPDLLFLDIHLSDGAGFDILTQSTYKDFHLIFITGFDQHAIKAIKVGALDYILKPIDEEEFKEAVSKAIQNSAEEKHLTKLAEISNEYFKGVQKKRVVVKTTNTVYAIYEDDILYCKSDGNYTTFYTNSHEKIVASKPLKKIVEVLSEDIFIRCHQSYLVNKKHVVKYKKNGVLILQDDTQIPVSSRRQEYVLKKIF